MRRSKKEIDDLKKMASIIIQKAQQNYFPEHLTDSAYFLLDEDRKIVAAEGSSFSKENLAYEKKSLVQKEFSDILHPADIHSFALATIDLIKKNSTPQIVAFQMGAGIKISKKKSRLPSFKHYNLSVEPIDQQMEKGYLAVIGNELRQWNKGGNLVIRMQISDERKEQERRNAYPREEVLGTIDKFTERMFELSETSNAENKALLNLEQISTYLPERSKRLDNFVKSLEKTMSNRNIFYTGAIFLSPWIYTPFRDLALQNCKSRHELGLLETSYTKIVEGKRTYTTPDGTNHTLSQ